MGIEPEKSLPIIARQFQIEGEVVQITPFGKGHIHHTYLVRTLHSNYLLQQINRHVFRDISGLMQNIFRVTEHLKQKKPDSPTLSLIPTTENNLYFERDQHNTWRCYSYIHDSVTYEQTPGPQIAFSAGRAYGEFIANLADFPVNELTETIPRFHDMFFRLEQLHEAIQNNVVSRAESVEEEITTVVNRADKLKFLMLQKQTGLLPTRVTHNDTKINNVLFDSQKNPICVVDLDTVMPGLVHSDFGDAIRTLANTAAEDEVNLDRVGFDTESYISFTKGFLHPLSPLLGSEEKETLVDGPFYMTTMQAMRFLTDYINGDRYYKITTPEHNLIRTRCQLAYLFEMEKNRSQMEKEIDTALR